jgi:hypothetical protein
MFVGFADKLAVGCAGGGGGGGGVVTFFLPQAPSRRTAQTATTRRFHCNLLCFTSSLPCA